MLSVAISTGILAVLYLDLDLIKNEKKNLVVLYQSRHFSEKLDLLKRSIFSNKFPEHQCGITKLENTNDSLIAIFQLNYYNVKVN